MNDHWHSQSQEIYEIQVEGELDQDWQAWFNSLAVTVNHTSGQSPITTTSLTLSVADQAALRGVLCKLWDLNLTLISLRRVAVDS